MDEVCGDFQLTDAQVNQFWTQGLLGPFTLCPPDDAAEFLERVQCDVLGRAGPCLRDECGEADRFSGRHLDSPTVRSYLMRPELVDRLQSLLGPSLLLFLTRFWMKEIGSKELPWHQDSTYWPIYPKVAVTAWIALTPSHRNNGCVRAIPGSHLKIYPQGRADDSMGFELTSLVPGEDLRQAVDLELRPGQLYLFDINTLHQSNANRGGEMRVGLQASFAPQLVKIPHDWFFEGHQNLVVGDNLWTPGINRILDLGSLACQKNQP